jgi:hypothetical protein
MCFKVGFIATALLLLLAQSVSAMEPAASFLVKLFMDACIPNMGHPEKVRAWADQRHLQAVTSPTALALFVGLKGVAWAVPSSLGSFALSIRGRTEGCAVWARTADPLDVETAFKKILEGVKRPGLEVRIDKGSTDQSPVVQVRSLVYNVRAVGAPSGFEFLMQTAEKPGGAFQASMQLHPVRAD